MRAPAASPVGAAPSAKATGPGHLTAPPAVPRPSSSAGRSAARAPVVPSVQSFEELVSEMITHQSFPLLVKKVHEVTSGRNVAVPGCGKRLDNADGDMRTLSNFASLHGVAQASARSTSMEVFLAAMLTALEDMKKHPAGVKVPRVLQLTLDTCGRLSTSESKLGVPSNARTSSAYPAIGRQVAPGPRPKLSAEARAKMEEWFRSHYSNPYPTDADKLELARTCSIQLNQVNNFFGNKRMRLKRKAIAMSESVREAANAAVPSEKINPSSVLAPRAKWRAVVLREIPNAPSISDVDPVEAGECGASTTTTDDVPQKKIGRGGGE